MTMRVFMENTDSLDRESYNSWNWTVLQTLSDVKVYDEKGNLTYNYNRDSWQITIDFRNDISYGQKYEYMVEGKFRLKEYNTEPFKKLESFARIYPYFNYYTTHLKVVIPREYKVDFPFNHTEKTEGNSTVVEGDVTKTEYTAIFVEFRKYKEISKQLSFGKKKVMVIAKSMDESWGNAVLDVTTKSLSILERLIAVPTQASIDRILVYQAKGEELGEKEGWLGWNFGGGISTYLSDRPSLISLLAHEYAHYWFLSGTQWINEGNADFYTYLTLLELGENSKAQEKLNSWKTQSANLQNVALSTASYEKYRNAIYTASALFIFDLHQKYGLPNLQKLNKYIVPEDVNSFEFYYYATKVFGEGVSGMFERRIFPKEDMPKINEFKKSYEEYLKTFNNITGLYERDGISTKTWREKKDDIKKQVDKSDFDATTVKEEIETAKIAEAALKKYEGFVANMKEKGTTLTDEQTQDLRKKLADRNFSTIDQDMEKAKNEVTAQTTTPPQTKPPETTTSAPKTPPPKTGFEAIGMILFLTFLALRQRT